MDSFNYVKIGPLSRSDFQANEVRQGNFPNRGAVLAGACYTTPHSCAYSTCRSFDPIASKRIQPSRRKRKEESGDQASNKRFDQGSTPDQRPTGVTGET